MAKPKFPKIEIVRSNPPDRSGVFTITVSRRVGNPPHAYERDVKPNDLVSSPEAAAILGVTVRHLYRLVEENRLRYRKKKKRLLFVSKEVQRLYLQLARARKGTKGPITEAFVIG
jgi:excisionase family DNA binding protein